MHLLIFLALLALCGVAMAITIIDDGKSDYRIVIPDAAIPSERYAAEELQHYLAKMSGVTLPIVSDTAPVAKGEILLGDNAHLRSLNLNLKTDNLGNEGFILRTQGNHLAIVGGRPRGTLYGVYAILEEKLGVRWYTPDAECVPSLTIVELPDLDETQIPAFDYREVFWTAVNDNANFAARHRLNGQRPRLAEKHGGKGMVYYPRFAHSMDELVSPGLYETHPEYFPFIDGKRVNGKVQRCLSNPDVLNIAIASLRNTLREHPEATLVSVTQNDNLEYCRCPQCKELDEAEGSPSASILRFVNTIAENLEGDYPEVKIDTFAYEYTRKPPKTIRPHKNVIIRLCSIKCCFAHPLDTCTSSRNHKFVDDIEAWEKIATRLDIWDYVTNFHGYLQPFPNFEVLQPNLQFFARHKVKGVFEQGNYHGNGEMAPLRTYLLAKLLWNPDADVEKLTDNFLVGYYGDAADAIRAYMKITHRPFHTGGGKPHMTVYDDADEDYLTDDVIDRADRILEEAESRTTDETLRFRVQTARLPLWYVQLTNNRVTGTARADLLQRFTEIARRSGSTHYAERKLTADWLKEMEAK